MSGENDSSDNTGSDSGKASGTFDVELGKKLENGVEAGCFGVLADDAVEINYKDAVMRGVDAKVASAVSVSRY